MRGCLNCIFVNRKRHAVATVRVPEQPNPLALPDAKPLVPEHDVDLCQRCLDLWLDMADGDPGWEPIDIKWAPAAHRGEQP